MKDILTKNLNPAQKEAVLCTEGPLIIFAGAGTGKTRVITHRIAYLLSLGVAPWSILAVTFTNKAAEEMKKRVNDLTPGTGANVFVSTFHSFCAYFLRVEASKINLSPDFLIYDFADQKNVIKDCLKELNYDDKKYKPSAVADRISRAKDDLKSPSDMAADAENTGDFFGSAIAKIYALYQKKLETAQALDFGDLIMRTVISLQQYPAILDHYQDRFKYILVDEYQDTNHAQYMLAKLLAGKHRNICVVGDDDQCIPEGSLISADKGSKKIELITKNDALISASGHGKTIRSKADTVKKKKYKGVLVKIKTKSGKTVCATPNHIGFARLNPQPGVYYIYLMYKEGAGYRIGQTQGIRSRKKDKLSNGLAIRLNQEHADKMWILHICKDKDSAIFFEQFISVKYGIPSMIFNAGYKKSSSKRDLKQTYCDRMFKEIDTSANVINLMRDFNIFEEYPHHQAQAAIRGNSSRRIVNLNLFSGRITGLDKGRHSHRICLNTSGEGLKNEFKKADFAVRNGQRNTWRIETERTEYDEAEKFVKNILAVSDLSLTVEAKLTSAGSFTAMPFSHFKPGMTVPVLNGGKITDDTIDEISYSDYDGFVYDLSVPDLRQFAVNGVVVHNSVYSWRGADINNILDFEKDYPQAKSVKLEQNYRSTPKILSTAYQVVKHNTGRVEKKLWTENADDGSVSVLKAANENDEALKVADIISVNTAKNKYNLSDFAVFYRTNAQSRVFEDAFRRAGMPYVVVGTLKFYDRAEIKDITAYLKLILNHNDNISFKRIINIPRRGIGKTSIENLEREALKRNTSIWQTIPFAKEAGLNKGTIATLGNFVSFIENLSQLKETDTVKTIAEKVITHSGYLKELEIENTTESLTKIENIKELISAIDDFERRSPDKSLLGYLTQIALISDSDSVDDSKGKVTLMTLHLAKGLEFDNVFVCGLEDGLFPIGESAFNPEELEEERRLMYVGMTRAKKNLYLCWASERMIYGKTRWNMASRFLAEAGFKDEFAGREPGQSPFKQTSFAGSFNRTKWSPDSRSKSKAEYKYVDGDSYDYMPSDDEIIKDEPLYAPAADKSPYKIGTMVSHPVFGSGKVIEKSGAGNDLKLVVLFENGQWKKLLARVSNLTVIN
ncbi:MAG: UvrD-helicase domain-containing protein [Endomicrobium sp.]|jgi:DNA helicase-2/ATP-dependent DNA helicase PcrA|nr:UvrD-helicase domain-containing protein [Endomicrobium sp.]